MICFVAARQEDYQNWQDACGVKAEKLGSPNFRCNDVKTLDGVR